MRTIKYELPIEHNPGKWLERVDGLLEGDAADWADQHPMVKKLLIDGILRNATLAAVVAFKALLLKRFTPLEGDLYMDMLVKLRGV